MDDQDQLLREIAAAVENADTQKIEGLMESAIEGRVPLQVLLEDGLGKGMDSVAQKFDRGLVFLPRLIASSRVIEYAIKLIPGGISSSVDNKKPTIVVGTVSGDVHTIGKDLCITMLRGAGYKVIDLGCDVPEEEFISAAKRKNVEVVAASASMTTTLNAQRTLVKECRSRKINVKCFVGGAPCSKLFSEEIGADGYSSTAYGLVELCRDLEKSK